jgi:hypothetical protein
MTTAGKISQSQDVNGAVQLQCVTWKRIRLRYADRWSQPELEDIYGAGGEQDYDQK